MKKVIDMPAKRDLQQALIELKRGIPVMIEHYQIMAEIKKAHFDALVSQGFTESQAIELCRDIGK